MASDLASEFVLLVGRMDAKLDVLLLRSDSHEVRLGVLETELTLARGGRKIAYAIAGAIGATFLACVQFLPNLFR
jgi:hypothetical protein